MFFMDIKYVGKTTYNIKKIFLQKVNMEPQSQAKKQVIIVTGKMGVGKSSFIKSLAKETEGEEIKIRGSIKSVTDTCKLFELDKNMLSLDTSNRIYLMDTPGLESLPDSHKIVLQIEKLVLAEKLQIIGVAFLFPLTNGQRLVDQENGSPIQQLFNLLTLRKSKKQKLFFPIITQYDLVYDEQIQEKYLELHKHFQQIKLNKMWEKKILWVSQCATTKKKYEKAYQDAQLRQIVDSKAKRLSEILNENMKLTLTYEEYLEDYNSYLQTVRSMIGEKKNIGNPEIAFSTIQKIEIQMEFHKKTKEKWWLKWSSKLTGLAGLASTIYRGWKFYGIIMAGLTGGIISLAAPIFLFVGSNVVASLIFLNVGVKNSVEKTEQSSMKKKQQLEREIEQFNLKMILSAFTEQVKIQDNSIIKISCGNIVKKVNKVTEVNNTSGDLLISQKDTKQIINLKFGEEQNSKKVIFNFDAWGLRSDELRNILVVATQKYYDHL